MFWFSESSGVSSRPRRGLTTFKALWPELRASLDEARQERARLDVAALLAEAPSARWARLVAGGRGWHGEAR